MKTKRTWNHRILAHKDPLNEIIFMVHEVHYTNGIPTDYTLDGVVCSGSSIEELNETIGLFKKATTQPILWYGDQFPKEYKP